MARSQLPGRDRNASGDISTVGKPRNSVAKQAPIRPMSWYSGSQLTNTSFGPALTAAPMARTLASRFACVSTTPLGLPVLPEVYCRKPMSPGLAAHRREAGTRRRHPDRPGISTARSDSTCARSS